ncbi:hypothetical protein [Algivirga pacifica]|uniref:DUF1648 domain-containing protein n=1 Tax=Algivirga pacifica TaxID=1162670 RepID=A0ABP9DLH8_9BACT
MKAVKYFWAISLLVYLGINLLIYLYLPSQVTVFENADTSISAAKGDFFYASMAVLLLVNISFTILGSGVLHIPKQLLLVPKKDFWLKNKETQEVLLKRTKGWARGIATIINMLLLTFVTMIAAKHMDNVPNVEVMTYILPILTILWIVFFFFLFTSTSNVEED